MKHAASGRVRPASADRRWVRFLLGMAAALATASAPAKDQAETLRLAYGTREISRTAAELGLRTTLLRRENFNAHGFDVLFVHGAGPSEAPEEKQLVPFFMQDGESASLRTHEGADCVLRDFRLTVSPESGLVVMVAERELHESYVEELPVRFRELTLHRNPEGVPGRPSLYFEESRSWQSKSSYCDVGEALQRELGLADRRPTG